MQIDHQVKPAANFFVDSGIQIIKIGPLGGLQLTVGTVVRDAF